MFFVGRKHSTAKLRDEAMMNEIVFNPTDKEGLKAMREAQDGPPALLARIRTLCDILSVSAHTLEARGAFSFHESRSQIDSSRGQLRALRLPFCACSCDSSRGAPPRDGRKQGSLRAQVACIARQSVSSPC